MEKDISIPILKKNFTNETLIFSLVFLLGAFFRFVHLGKLPLSDYEASIALAAYNPFSENTVHFFSDQVLLVNLLRSFFYLFGPSALLARALPAFFGSLLIFLPILIKKQIKPALAMILSLWIAIDPTLVSISRQVDSTLLFILSIFLTLYFFFKKSFAKSAIFLVISLLCGRIFYWFLFPAMLSFLYIYYFGNIKYHSLYRNIKQLFLSADWKRFGISAGISYLALSTFGLIFPTNLAGIGLGFQNYLSGWTGLSIVRTFDLLRALLLYELPVVIFGIIGIFFLFKKNRSLGLLLFVFICLNILQLTLMADKFIILNSFIVIPLIISASYFILGFVKIPRGSYLKILLVTFISLSVFIFINLTFFRIFSNPNQNNEENSLKIVFIIAGFILILAAGLLAGWAIHWKIAGKSFLNLAIIYFFIITISATVNAAGLRDPYQNDILSIDPFPVNADLLIKTLMDYSGWNFKEKTVMNIFVIGEQPPSLFWALKDFKNVHQRTTLPKDEKIDAVITSNHFTLEQTNAYSGQEILWETKTAWSLMNNYEYVYWFLTRRAPQDTLAQKAFIVWINSSLFPGMEN